MIQTPLVLASDYIGGNGLNSKTTSDNLVPRRDYIEIVQRLGAELSSYDLFDAAWYRWTRRPEKHLKLDIVQGLVAANQVSRHNIMISTSEKAAIPLAIFLSIKRRQIPHIVIAHKMSSGYKTHLWKLWALHRTFSHVICNCMVQANYAIDQLGLPRSNVDFVYHPVDHLFFHPLKVQTDNYILTVGQEQRDYQTLLSAISGTGIKLVIVASSPWSTSQIEIDKSEDVTVLSHISYHELRKLYARARLIVNSLFNVDYAAGTTSVLEAMAMAKPVIVSRTNGNTDYVVNDETGLYVSPGNTEELRDTILSLWGKSAQMRRLGMNARQVIEEHINLDIHVNRVVQIVREALTT